MSATQDVARHVVEAAAQISEMITQPAIEAALGYRCQLEEAGFSPAISEQMAANYHVELLKILFAAIAAAQGRRPA